MNSSNDSQAPACDVVAPPAAELLAAYIATRYCVEAGPQSFCVVGEPSVSAEDFLVEHGAQRAAIVTACNPQSRRLTAPQNAARHAELLAEVRAAGITALPSANHDPAGRWPAEQGLCLLDPPAGFLAALLVRYTQYAAVVIERNSVARLEWHPAIAQIYCDRGIAPAD